MEAVDKEIVVYTALFGRYDNLSPAPEHSSRCDFICFTDRDLGVKGWKTIIVECGDHSPVVMNRKYKILAHRYLGQYEYSIYVDSNIYIRKEPSSLVDKYLSSVDMACPKHFERDCLYDEIAECISLEKISEEEGRIVKEKYKAEFFPEKFGLAENNILLRKHNEQRVKSLMEDWWREFSGGPKRDQLSLMVVVWRNDFEMRFMDESARNNNQFFRYRLHADQNSSSLARRISASIRASKNKNSIYRIGYLLLEFIGHVTKRLKG